MADWQTVRFDPAYPEPLDPEIVSLCDAMNAAGLRTTTSCCGHGTRWPYVTFEHDSDDAVEAIARYVMAGEVGDYRPYFTMWQRETLPDGRRWSLHIHLNEVYANTPPEDFLHAAVQAMARVAALLKTAP
jgi:hypothetical protein